MNNHFSDLLVVWFTGVFGVVFFSFAWISDHLHQLQTIFGMICTALITISTIAKTWLDVWKTRRERKKNSLDAQKKRSARDSNTGGSFLN